MERITLQVTVCMEIQADLWSLLPPHLQLPPQPQESDPGSLVCKADVVATIPVNREVTITLSYGILTSFASNLDHLVNLCQVHIITSDSLFLFETRVPWSRTSHNGVEIIDMCSVFVGVLSFKFKKQNKTK